MKRIFILTVTIIILLAAHASAEGISVYFNDSRLSFDQEPVIRDDSVLVPFRAIFERLDMTVQWFGEERRVTAADKNTTITMHIDQACMEVNGEITGLPTAPVIYNGYTMVPLRAISEAAGAEVSWDGDTQSVYIETNESNFGDWAELVLIFTNFERAENGLDDLEWDASLAELAELHCSDMIERGYFSHNTPEGETPFDRMKKSGIEYRAAGENIAAGQTSAKAAVEAWMDSPTHRANILNPKFKYLGVSVKKGGAYGTYWVQEFAEFK